VILPPPIRNCGCALMREKEGCFKISINIYHAARQLCSTRRMKAKTSPRWKRQIFVDAVICSACFNFRLFHTRLSGDTELYTRKWLPLVLHCRAATSFVRPLMYFEDRFYSLILSFFACFIFNYVYLFFYLPRFREYTWCHV
jgi:hypothetical protein